MCPVWSTAPAAAAGEDGSSRCAACTATTAAAATTAIATATAAAATAAAAAEAEALGLVARKEPLHEATAVVLREHAESGEEPAVPEAPLLHVLRRRGAVEELPDRFRAPFHPQAIPRD